MDPIEIKALTKYVRISPKKAREVARQIQGMSASKAIDLLSFIPRKSAQLILKTLRSAIANAENNHDMYQESLMVQRALVHAGPKFKRHRPAARGSAHPYCKHTSHILIILQSNTNN